VYLNFPLLDVVQWHAVHIIFRNKVIVERRMPSSGMLRCVALVRTDVSEEPISSIIKMTRISELGTISAVTNNPEHPAKK
jgi:hypothetical protein